MARAATRQASNRDMNSSREMAVPNFDEEENPAPIYLDLMVHCDLTQSIPLTATFDIPYNKVGLGSKSFQIIWLKRSLCKALKDFLESVSERLNSDDKNIKNSVPEIKEVKFQDLNLVFKGKILSDDDNIFNAGIKDGCNVSLIYKTEARKEVEESAMDHSLKFLRKDEGRGEEQKVELSARQKRYQDNIFGLSETKFEMLVDTMMQNPILIQRYSENKMVQRLIDDKEIIKEITNEIPYFNNLRKENKNFDRMMNGQDQKSLNDCRSFISDTSIVRSVTTNMKNSEHNLKKLLDYIIEPSIKLNPIENPSILLPVNGQDPISTNREEDQDDMIYKKKETSTTNTDSGMPKGIRQDLTLIYKKYMSQFNSMQNMGFPESNLILECLKEENGDLNRAIDKYIEINM